MDVAAQSVELGNRNRALASSRVSQGRGKLRSAVEGIRALARFDLRVLAHDFEALRSGKTDKGLALRFQAQPGTALFCRRNSMVSNDWSNHDDTLFTHVLVFDNRCNIKLDLDSSSFVHHVSADSNGTGVEGKTATFPLSR